MTQESATQGHLRQAFPLPHSWRHTGDEQTHDRDACFCLSFWKTEPGLKGNGSEWPGECGRKGGGPTQQPPSATNLCHSDCAQGTESKEHIFRLWSPFAQRFVLSGRKRSHSQAERAQARLWSSGHLMPLCQQEGLRTGQRAGTVRGHLDGVEESPRWASHSSSSWRKCWSPEGLMHTRRSEEGLAGHTCHWLNHGAQRGLRRRSTAAWRSLSTRKPGGGSHAHLYYLLEWRHRKRVHNHSDVTRLGKITSRLNEWIRALKILTGWNDGWQLVRWNLIRKKDCLGGFPG